MLAGVPLTLHYFKYLLFLALVHLMTKLSAAHDLDPSCNTTCIATQCQLGCAFLSQALVTSCRQVCNEIELVGKKPYYCQFGCLRAINESIDEKIKQIGIPPAPYIKPVSLTHTSVRLAWNSGSLKNINFLVQWKYESLSSEWTYYRRDKPVRESQILVERLRPYTKYRFRVAYLISPHSLPIFSKPSVVIQTKPYGAPSSPPKIQRLAAVDSSQIQISWEPPDFSNGPVIAYTLYLSSSAMEHTEVKEISVHKPPEDAADYRHNQTQFSYDFPDLKPRTMYTVSISCSNMVGEGPMAVGDVRTSNGTTDPDTEPEPFSLIVASQSQIKLQKKDTREAAEVMFLIADYNQGAKITNLALHVRAKSVYVADTSGTVWRLPIGNLKYLQAEKILQNNRSSVNSTGRLTVDWVNDVLYIAQGSTIKCCKLNGSEERNVIEEVPGKVMDMHIDAYNGYLYWTSDDLNSTGIYRIAVRSLDGPAINQKKAECIHKSTRARIFTLDPQIQRIYIPETIDGLDTILSLSMDGKNVTKIRDDKMEFSQLKNVSSIVHFNASFCWTSGRELFMEEYHPETNKFYHNAIVFEDNLDDFVSIQVLHSDIQPYPVPTQATETTTLTTHVEDSTYPQRRHMEVPPAPVELKVIELNGAPRVTWAPVERHSSASFGYELWQRCYEQEVWLVVYKGENNYWIPKHEEFTTCAFRVNAFNEYGRGNFSVIANNESSTSVKKLKLALHNNLPYIVAVFIPLLATVVGFLLFRSATKKLDIEKKIMHAEIVQLPELPGHPHENNAHYLPGDVTLEEDLTAVPQITRNQINFTKFLGSGAFAEVYEGLAHDFCGEVAVKVAIKTLRSGATLEQKSDFLKEAKLMDNFKHKHILKLLGICLDSNPFLIFELMEGGDLLSYLRLNRPEGDKSSPLKMEDLFSISIDVAKGCKYLEEMHYVHRDLAARNCLVSSYNKPERVVKIGDFGLARDIYKNDYYRKEGEGLLPVRWMAPESLTDGIFTTQSDVWSFGVLLWEVLTLGQQPYQARANVEVWNYVRNGGRLVVPSNCPYDLQSLLNKCWNFDAKQRPDFSFCLKVLESAKQKLSMCDLSATSVHNQNYSIYNYTNTVGWPNQSFSSETVAIDDLENVSVHSQNSNYLKPFTSMENVNVDEDGYKFPYLHLLKQGDKIPEKIMDAFINIETKIN